MKDKHLTLVAASHSVLSALPAAFPIALWAYAIRASLIIGRWPYYDHPDPKNLHLYRFHEFVGSSFVISLVSALAWIVITAILFKTIPSDTLKRNSLVFLLATILLPVQVMLDPGGLFEWYCD